jgi:hypothetical protein
MQGDVDPQGAPGMPGPTQVPTWQTRLAAQSASTMHLAVAPTRGVQLPHRPEVMLQ